MASDWITQTPRAIAEALAQELDAVFHARADLYVLDPVPGDLCDPRGGGAVLNVRSTLATLVMASAQPMDVDTARDTALNRIHVSEQQWLNGVPYTLLVPLRTRSVEIIGILALGPKRSELPSSDSDRRALMAIATPVALALENNRLRSAPDSQTPPAAGECVSCSRVYQPGAAECVCGGQVVEAAAPYLLRGVFRFERRLGSGGMGVVYLARDLSLGRSVAIKTLPHLGSKHQARLQSEAQAMASIVDANLAVIYRNRVLARRTVPGQGAPRRGHLGVAAGPSSAGHCRGRRPGHHPHQCARPPARRRHHPLRHQAEQHRFYPHRERRS